MKTDNYILSLQEQLVAAASLKTKTWWERYLRGVAAFRGVGIPQIREILCGSLIRREERFAKTAVGWLPRDVSKYDAGFAFAFVEAHAESFSLESARNAFKYMDGNTTRPLLKTIKRAEQHHAADGASRRL